MYSIHIYSYCKIVTWEYMQYNILYLVNKNHGLLKSMSSCQAISMNMHCRKATPSWAIFDKNILITWLFGSGYSKRHRIQNTHVYLTPTKASKSKSRCIIWLLLGVFLPIYMWSESVHGNHLGTIGHCNVTIAGRWLVHLWRHNRLTGV